MRNLFILVPADTPDGPVKGAYALANALAALRNITLVSMKRGPGAEAPLDARVRRLCLADHESGFAGKLRHYRGLLCAAGGRAGVASISMCLSADALNAMCRAHAVTCSSVRGNLINNYRMDYGLRGVPLGAAHLLGLRRFDHVVAMTRAMSRQVRTFAGRVPAIIGNFVDEAALDHLREPGVSTGPLRFAFVGSLSERKQPWLIVQALATLRERGELAVLDLIGTGPMQARVQADIERLGLTDSVRLRGFMNSPYELLTQADAMVLPSLSEGVSRAALEALHLGVPCVMREVDGNSELIRDGINGALFSGDPTLAAAMLRAARANRQRSAARTSLLPDAYRQQSAASQYLNLVERGEA